tara:strand:- start:771 stop:1484 length:714 start_codon:yes stop_codon:yes gene_type:complete
MWKVKILTASPEFYDNIFEKSLYAKGIRSGIWQYEIRDIRSYALNKHSSIDSKPYGGGSGMVLRSDVVGDAIDDFFGENSQIFYLSPRGKHFTQERAEKMIHEHKTLNLLSCRFEGMDERIITQYKIQEISLGDFVLTNGDIAVLALVDCCLRFLPKFLGNVNALEEESFGRGIYKNLLEYPLYTKPPIWRGHKVPTVLLSGHHKKILEWRLDMAKKLTKIRRDDLWHKHIQNTENE